MKKAIEFLLKVRLREVDSILENTQDYDEKERAESERIQIEELLNNL